MPAVFDIVIAKSDAYFYNTLVIFCFLHFSLNSLIRFRLISMLIENKSNFLEWMFSVRYYNPRKFSSVPRCQHRLHTRCLLVFLLGFGLKTCSSALFEKNEIAAFHKAGLKSTDNSALNGKPSTNNIWCFKKY
jgi:hypothetical protein